jgi:membrane associated rhomboid family serine protease
MLGINVVAFAMMALANLRLIELNPAILLDWGATYGPLTFNGQPWRLLTSMFLHGGLSHLFVNMWFLACLGRIVERLIGGTAYLLLYLLAGLVGALADLAWFPGSVAVGASAAVYGVCGAFLAAYLRHRPWARRSSPAPQGAPAAGSVPDSNDAWPVGGARLYLLLLLFGVFNLVHGYLARESNLPAHLGGFLTGLLLGALLTGPERQEGTAQPARRRVHALLAGVCLLGVVWWMAYACAGQTNRLLWRHDHFFTRERAILARCDDVLQAWADERITSIQMSREIQSGLADWRGLRAELQRQLSAGDAGPFTTLLMEYASRRETSLQRLTVPLETEESALKAITGFVEAELFRDALMEEANRGNPLREKTGFPRHRRREKSGDPWQDRRLDLARR